METKTPLSYTDLPALDNSPGRTLGWAAFLGASWTWVIGMYLPVLLVRDFGLWGWVVFALPNVIGAAAMGAVVLTADRSRKILAQHAPMATAFSIVTIAFHVFFVGWMLVQFVPLYAVTGTFLAAAIVFLVGGGRRDVWLAVLVLLVSIGCLIALLTQPLDPMQLFRSADPQPELLALTPVCMFGFFLCPYLDLTFHRARQAMEPKAGIRAFQIGFGVFFLTMILFSLLYADFLAWERWRPGVNVKLLAWVLFTHMSLQIAYTLSVHARAVVGGASKVRFSRIALVLAMAIAMGLAVYSQHQQIRRFYPFQMQFGEVIYRCFMGFYGLIFPAYVWLCMIPKGEANAPDRGKWLRFIIAVVLAMPFFWLGFVERRYWWLLVGLAIVIGMRWTIKGPPRASSPAGAFPVK